MESEVTRFRHTSPAMLLCEGDCRPGGRPEYTPHRFVRLEHTQAPSGRPVVYACTICGSERVWGCDI